MAVGWPFGLIKLGVTLQHWTAHDTAVPDAAIYCFSCVHIPRGIGQLQKPSLHMQVRAGHGAGKPTEKVIEEAADTYAFAAEVIGASWEMQELNSEPMKASSAQYTEQRML